MMDKVQLFDSILFGTEYKFWSKKYDQFLAVIQKDGDETELFIIKDLEKDVLYCVKITNELLSNHRKELNLGEVIDDNHYMAMIVHSLNNFLSMSDSTLEIEIEIKGISHRLYSEIALDKTFNNIAIKNILKLNDMYKQLTKILESKEDKVEVKMQTEKVSNTYTSPCILKKRKS